MEKNSPKKREFEEKIYKKLKKNNKQYESTGN